MRKDLIALLGVTALLMPVPGFGKAKMKTINYKGWDSCCELSNSLVRVVIVPQIGGRIMEYSTQGRNVIWQNPAELGVLRPAEVGKLWHNYGGYKAWNAPQALWRAPDYDNYYDYAPATIEPIEDALPDGMVGVRVSCKPIDHLGFQFVREVFLAHNSSHVRVVETMKNVSDKPIQWSVWEVTQVARPGIAALPLGRTEDNPQGWHRLMDQTYPDPKQARAIGNVAFVDCVPVIDKVGSSSPDGWLAYFSNGAAYIKQWRVQPNAEYPDGGCNSEVFTADSTMGNYVELEVLGPITQLLPGENTQLVEDWYLVDMHEPVTDAENAARALHTLKTKGYLPRSSQL